MARWEHFEHGADVGVRGIGATLPEAFEQCALALIAAMIEPARIRPEERVAIACEAPAPDLLLVEWLNAIVYEMAVRRMVFGRFEIAIAGNRLTGSAWGEHVDRFRHEPAAEVKGATYTALRVEQKADGEWLAQCIVDV
ncbi:MAG: archease [Parvibaculum sp.]|uniref:archease n=1 Tax=Parvibaculum sp. TaxID=2024848 RepID=UPI003C719D88